MHPVEPQAPGGRLRAALERREMSVREFHRRMKGAVAGSSYPHIHRILADTSEPTLEFLRQAAKVLEVRHEYLMVGGPMTVGDMEAAATVDGISLAAAMTMKRSITEELGREYWQEALELRDSVLQGWARRGTVFMLPGYMPHWVASLAALRQRLNLDAEQLGEVLAAPLRALGIDPGKLNRSGGEPLATYIISMMPVLMALAPELEAQRTTED